MYIQQNKFQFVLNILSFCKLVSSFHSWDILPFFFCNFSFPKYFAESGEIGVIKKCDTERNRWEHSWLSENYTLQ